MTKRERWLVTEGYIAGFAKASAIMRNKRISEQADEWLNTDLADGVTVAMALSQEANKHDQSEE